MQLDQTNLSTWKRASGRLADGTRTVARSGEFAAFQRQELLELARGAMWSVLSGREAPGCDRLSGKLREKRACFVTLFKGKALRGCIGNLLPEAPLYEAVIDNARGAAFRDPRFPLVSCAELPLLKIEISVLTEPQPVRFSSPGELLEQLHPHLHGVLLEAEGRLATFLPQVWGQFPQKITFLNRLAEKAGCAAGIWRNIGASISLYQVECFEEDRHLPEYN
jgi:AmmeMemoRadiSam system protein A